MTDDQAVLLDKTRKLFGDIPSETSATVALCLLHAAAEHLVKCGGPKATWDVLTNIVDEIQTAANRWGTNA